MNIENDLKDLQIHFDQEDILFEEEIIEEKSNNDDDLDLEPIRQFMEDFIGMVITDIHLGRNIESLSECDLDIGKKISIKIISSVDVINEKIEFRLNNIKGANAGKLIISPTRFGMFAEKLSEDDLDSNSVYRILFYGGFCLEYLDSKGLGMVTYQE